jgi:hypothetical protein
VSYVLAFCAPPGRADEYLGDAEEEFQRIVSRFGVKPARWLYRAYVGKVILAIIPLILDRLKGIKIFHH